MPGVERISSGVDGRGRIGRLSVGQAQGILGLLGDLIWLVYTAVTFSSIGWSPISLVFPFVLWGVIGVVAGIAAYGFLSRYAKQT